METHFLDIFLVYIQSPNDSLEKNNPNKNINCRGNFSNILYLVSNQPSNI